MHNLKVHFIHQKWDLRLEIIHAQLISATGPWT